MSSCDELLKQVNTGTEVRKLNFLTRGAYTLVKSESALFDRNNLIQNQTILSAFRAFNPGNTKPDIPQNSTKFSSSNPYLPRRQLSAGLLFLT